MNLGHLGDALDYWKGGIISQLQQANLLVDLAIEPMAHDAAFWTRDDWQLYARLLSVDESLILSHSEHLTGNRSAYFTEIMHTGDLFLDPDTGIATGNVSGEKKLKYLLRDELVKLLGTRESRVVALYQHGARKKMCDRLDDIIRYLRYSDISFACGSCECGTVAMLFFSRDSNRVLAINEHFKQLLGRNADRRINFW